jgi:excisionase family DNA binding protein
MTDKFRAEIGQPEEGSATLTVGEASVVLLVSPSTLRRWTEKGLVPVATTPGGHRRYRRQVIEELAQTLGMAKAMADPDQQSMSLPANIGVSHEDMKAEGWYSSLARPESAPYMRSLGQRLLGLLIQHISRTNGDERLLDEAREVGGLYGQHCYAYGASLPKTVEAFLYFRKSFAQMALQVPRIVRSSDALEIVRLAHLIDMFMDSVLSGLAEGYETSPAALPVTGSEGTDE